MFGKLPFAAASLGFALAMGVTFTAIEASRADAPRKVDKEIFEKGKKAFKRKQCAGCHVMDSSELGEKGPGLKGIYRKRGEEWLKKWLKDPAALEKTDPRLSSSRKSIPTGCRIRNSPTSRWSRSFHTFRLTASSRSNRYGLAGVAWKKDPNTGSRFPATATTRI